MTVYKAISRHASKSIISHLKLALTINIGELPKYRLKDEQLLNMKILKPDDLIIFDWETDDVLNHVKLYAGIPHEDTDLAVVPLARRAAVLTCDTDGIGSLFGGCRTRQW